MKKRLLVIIMLLAGTLGAGAAQVSVNDAKQKAAAFCARAVPSHIMCSPRASSSLTLAYTSKADASGDNCFYVFNRGVDDGYVIVSADDRASAVLGYADSGTFDENLNCVAPGPVFTPILGDFVQMLGQERVEKDAHRMKRPALADEIAPVVAFLCADESRWVSGINLPVDGGLASTYV